METYEYIFAAVIIVAILIAASFLTSITPQLYRSTSEISQLKTAAQKIMVEILLNPGSPTDWGKNISVKSGDLSSLGLVAYTEFTRSAYVLDPDKVQRLSQNLPENLRIKPSDALKLLNLGFDYGIKIEFIPALNINISPGLNAISVKVASEQGMPAVNANVTAFAAYANNFSRGVGSTDSAGNCVISLQYSSPALIVVAADYHGIQMVNVTMVDGGGQRGFIIGKFLLIDSSLGSINDEAYQIFVVRLPNGSLDLRYVRCNLTPLNDKKYSVNGYTVYDIGFEEPYLVAAVALARDNRLIAAYKVVPNNYGSATGDVYPPLAYMLERSVKIGPSTYTLRLRVWKTSW